MSAVESTPIVDVDSHISEPPDLWTSRVPSKWTADVPRVVFSETLRVDDWVVGDRRLFSPGFLAMAGHDDYQPNVPARYSDFDPGAWKPKPRLARLDEFDIYAQVLFPNVLAFFSWPFVRMTDQKLAILCYRIYNDFAAEFASEDRRRLIPTCVVPFWNIDESVRELRRAHELGHRGFVFGWDFQNIGLPPLSDPHWEPLLKVAEELEMPVNLHIAAVTGTEQDTTTVGHVRNEWDSAAYAKQTALMMLGNAGAIAELVTTGIVNKYPRLKWISIESGFGYIPFLLEALDWQWHNSGVARQHPDLALPSLAFRSNVFGSFWFERESMGLLESYAGNMLFETDYPHPTSLSPGPASTADPARVHVKRTLADVPDRAVQKVLFENAAALFKIAPPEGSPSTATMGVKQV